MVSTPREIPKEAIEHYERALDVEIGENDVSAHYERASELALAIKKSNGFYPMAHAQLGYSLWMLGDEKKAREELNTAIRQEHCNTIARAILLLMNMDNLGVKQTMRTKGWLDLLIVGGEVAAAKNKLRIFSNEIDELARAYPEDIQGSDNIEYWISVSELMLNVHDMLQDIQALPRKERLAVAVLNTPWSEIEIPEEFEQQVNDIKRRAEGRVLLAK